MTPPDRLSGSRAALVALTFLAANACQQAPVGTAVEELASPPIFVGRVWLSADTADAPGTIRVFLPDGTLVMDSCVEGYRLSSWRTTSSTAVEWDEDTARIEADVVEASAEVLRLRLTLRGGEVRDETYRPATVPFVCPDQPRQLADIGDGLGAAIGSCQ